MKNIFFDIRSLVIGLAFITLSFASCKKLIEIPANPPSSITQAQQFADSSTAISAVAGIYAYNSINGFAYSDARLTYCTGLSADELSYTQSDDVQQFYNYSISPLNSGIISLWSNHYQNIYRVNAVLNGVTNNSGLSSTFQKQVTGEMEVVRALYYFNMVNLYGGVPLVTSTSYNVTDRLPRADAGVIYKQVIADLTDARKKLIAAYPSAGRARPNLYTATALMAKVNLYLGNWQSAYDEADSVIQSGHYTLEPSLNSIFLDGSNEAIWQLPADQGYNGVADAQYFIPSFSAPSYLLTTHLLNAFEPGDQRRQNWTASTIVNGKLLYYPYKYKNVMASATPTEDQMVFRLGEVYLIRAEAAAHLNKLDRALADVNTIRARAGLTPSQADPTSQTAILNAVMHERQVELFCEWGNRWFDLKRTGNAAAVLGAEKNGYHATAALYAIPQSQILVNNLLKQNPGY